MKKHPILFKASAILSYLFLFFGLFWTTQFWSNYWEFSSWVGNLIWIRNIISLLFICFNYLTAKHVQGTNEGWNLFIAYSETNFAEFGVYLTLIVLGPLMEELVCRGLLQHAFFKNSRWGLDLLFPSFLFALPHFSSLPSLADIFVYTAVGCLYAWLTRYTKSIYPSYSIHIVNNIIANLPFLLTFLHRILG